MARLKDVTFDQWKAGIRFLVHPWTEHHPTLSRKEQKSLQEFMRGPFTKGMSLTQAKDILVDGMGWKPPRGQE